MQNVTMKDKPMADIALTDTPRVRKQDCKRFTRQMREQQLNMASEALKACSLCL